ncbi:unnamed protein product, partial [Amoebophrya sp. A25]
DSASALPSPGTRPPSSPASVAGTNGPLDTERRKQRILKSSTTQFSVPTSVTAESAGVDVKLAQIGHCKMVFRQHL